jgi:mannosyltransferase
MHRPSRGAEAMEMLRNLDAVHGSYYAFMQVRTGIFGTSPFATRMPSALACALTAAAVTTLRARLADRATGLCSGAILACLPITTQVGQEARGTAIALTAVAWSAVFLDVAIRRGGSAWVWYSLTLTLGILFFLQSALLIVANLVTLLWMAMGRAI